jgi:hypothetical protein
LVAGTARQLGTSDANRDRVTELRCAAIADSRAGERRAAERVSSVAGRGAAAVTTASCASAHSMPGRESSFRRSRPSSARTRAEYAAENLSRFRAIASAVASSSRPDGAVRPRPGSRTAPPRSNATRPDGRPAYRPNGSHTGTAPAGAGRRPAGPSRQSRGDRSPRAPRSRTTWTGTPGRAYPEAPDSRPSLKAPLPRRNRQRSPRPPGHGAT